jgi:hypothetical protein
MSWRYVHLGINPVGALASPQNPWPNWPTNFNLTVESYLRSLGGDWYRYAAQNYVVWTNWDITQLAQGLAGLPGFQNVYVLVTEMDLQFYKTNGWMPQKFWDWIYQFRLQK